MPSLRLFVSGSRHLRDSDAPYPTPIFTDQKALLLGGQATGWVTGQRHVAISDRAGLNLLLSAAPVTPGGGRQHEVSLMAWTGQTLEIDGQRHAPMGCWVGEALLPTPHQEATPRKPPEKR